MPQIGKMSINLDHHIKFNDEERYSRAAGALNKLLNEMEFICVGSSRACFKGDDGRVLKFPLSDGGEHRNFVEGKWKGERFAKGEHRVVADFVCVVQEFIEPMSHEQLRKINAPDWVYENYAGQVGVSKDGKLKSYDFESRPNIG